MEPLGVSNTRGSVLQWGRKLPLEPAVRHSVSEPDLARVEDQHLSGRELQREQFHLPGWNGVQQLLPWLRYPRAHRKKPRPALVRWPALIDNGIDVSEPGARVPHRTRSGVQHLSVRGVYEAPAAPAVFDRRYALALPGYDHLRQDRRDSPRSVAAGIAGHAAALGIGEHVTRGARAARRFFQEPGSFQP